MHDESQVNTMDPLEDVSNPNINDGVREFTSDSEEFPCAVSEEDAVVDTRKAAEEIINDSQGAESSGVNASAMDWVNDMVPCNGKRPSKPPRCMHVVECWGDGSGSRSLGAERKEVEYVCRCYYYLYLYVPVVLMK
ncbi:hypothetical protein NDU88_002174 [Pleurodeles waltl]|uniref:Uncharacterized protein n=1 Tax=Pleurodeles waltl TaxID=8319 RepID=A0AAV7LBP8_PLEWA|nr:hypothetical protein NDU88_002174 [Pleurodeles waltl]